MQIIIAFIIVMYVALHPSVMAKSATQNFIPGYGRIFSADWRILAFLNRQHHHQSPLLKNGIHTSYYGEPLQVLEHSKIFTKSRPSKRICNVSKRALRSTFTKRYNEDYFADTWEEVEEKENRANQAELMESKRLKREIGEDLPEIQLAWTCMTARNWTNLGDNYYPRFVLNISCMSNTCVNGNYRCAPRGYEVNVLQRLNTTEMHNCDDSSLPDSLQPHWKFTPIRINRCCDCTSMY